MNEGAAQIANADQARAWDGPDGDNWTDHEEFYNAAVRFLTPVLLEAAAIGAGANVLDIGCGCGETTRLAARAAAEGGAFGIDLSSRMIERARERAIAEDLTNARFEQGDAQVFAFEPTTFDAAISRFGSMFFEDPIRAYGNIRRALRPSGTIAMLWWRELRRNEWVSALRDALAAGRVLPEPPAGAPSPFAFADPDRAHAVLGEAGFTGITLDSIEAPVYFGSDATDATRTVMTFGIVQGLLKDLDDRARSEALDILRKVIASHETKDGVLFDSSAWLVRASNARGDKEGS
jgi:SAM-dependent methyltransferase